MEETYNVKAIILNKKNFSEDDSKVIIYSRESGKLELVARGTKKIKSKLAGHLEPISLSNIMIIRGKQYDYIGAAVGEQFYNNIKSDLDKLAIAGQAIKILDKLVKPGVADEEIFILLKDYLDALNNIKFDYDILNSFFVFKFLDKLGHKPELSFCVNCVNKIQPGNNRFDLAKGGLICSKCSDLKNKNQLFISDDGIKLLRLILTYSFKQLKKINTNKKLNKEIQVIINLFQLFSCEN